MPIRMSRRSAPDRASVDRPQPRLRKICKLALPSESERFNRSAPADVITTEVWRIGNHAARVSSVTASSSSSSHSSGCILFRPARNPTSAPPVRFSSSRALKAPQIFDQCARGSGDAVANPLAKFVSRWAPLEMRHGRSRSNTGASRATFLPSSSAKAFARSYGCNGFFPFPLSASSSSSSPSISAKSNVLQVCVRTTARTCCSIFCGFSRCSNARSLSTPSTSGFFGNARALRTAIQPSCQ